MKMTMRPLPVTIIASVYIAMGTIGFIYHLKNFSWSDPLQFDGAWVEVIRIIAIVSGVFLLRGHNWARWVAIAWIMFHVILSLFHSLPEFAMHVAFCLLVLWAL